MSRRQSSKYDGARLRALRAERGVGKRPEEIGRLTDELTRRYGEQFRTLIASALALLVKMEAEVALPRKTNKREYIREAMSRVVGYGDVR